MKRLLDLAKYSNDPTSMPKELIDQGYQHLQQYCDENNLDIKDVIEDEKNIDTASKVIHSKLNWLLRKTISQDSIKNLIFSNIDFIRTEVNNRS